MTVPAQDWQGDTQGIRFVPRARCTTGGEGAWGAYPTAPLVLGALQVGRATQDDFIDHQVVWVHSCVRFKELHKRIRIDRKFFTKFNYQDGSEIATKYYKFKRSIEI